MNAINGNSNSVLKGTAVAAGTGAVVTAGLNLLGQKVMLNNAGAYIDGFKKSIGDATLKDPSMGQKLSKIFEPTINMLKSGKVSWKMARQAATIGAAVVGGIYLAYRGIKALFAKKD